MNAALIAKLIEAGTPADLVAEVAIELGRAHAAQEILEKRREKDRKRKSIPRNSTESEESAETSEKGSLEVSPENPLPKPSKTSPLTPPQTFGDAWNAAAEQIGLSKVASVTGDRLKALKARIAEHGEQAVFDAIAAVKRSPHWRGENGSWAGNFDSMLRPGNFRRLIEGGYDPPKAKCTGPPSFLSHLRQQRASTGTPA